MSAMASQITGLMIVYSTIYSGADQSEHQSFTEISSENWTWQKIPTQRTRVVKKQKLADHQRFGAFTVLSDMFVFIQTAAAP